MMEVWGNVHGKCVGGMDLLFDCGIGPCPVGEEESLSRGHAQSESVRQKQCF